MRICKRAILCVLFLFGLFIAGSEILEVYYIRHILPKYEIRASYILNKIDLYKQEYGAYPTNIEPFIGKYEILDNEMYLPKDIEGDGRVYYMRYSDEDFILIIGDYYKPNVIYHSRNGYFEYNQNTSD